MAEKKATGKRKYVRKKKVVKITKKTAKQRASTKASKERVEKLKTGIAKSAKNHSAMIKAGIDRELGLRSQMQKTCIGKVELNRRIRIRKRITKLENEIRKLYREITRPTGKRL